MKTSFVDCLIRVRVQQADDDDRDPADVVAEDSNYEVVLEPGDGGTPWILGTELLECVTAGEATADGVLLREDGKTGRNVELSHSPPIGD